MDDVVIDVRGLRKEYGDVVPIDHLDLQVRSGEVYALLGPNGAGKTTTVEILTGVRSRTSGEVSVLGDDPAKDRRAWRARLGIVPQSTGEYHDVTIGQILTQFASFYPNPYPPQEILERVGLGDLTKRNCTALSGGQRRRLDVAIGLVGRPDLVFLDEPTTGLDPEARREAWQLIRDSRDDGVTTVLTTHYLDEAEELADRVGIIAKGRLRQEGTVAELGQLAGYAAAITFARADWLPSSIDPELGELEFDDSSGTLTTNRPTAAMAELLRIAREHGVDEIVDLQLRRPSLEATYLTLVHHNDAVGDQQ